MQDDYFEKTDLFWAAMERIALLPDSGQWAVLVGLVWRDTHIGGSPAIYRIVDAVAKSPAGHPAGDGRNGDDQSIEFLHDMYPINGELGPEFRLYHRDNGGKVELTPPLQVPPTTDTPPAVPSAPERRTVRLCTHADADGAGMHFLAAGEVCSVVADE